MTLPSRRVAKAARTANRKDKLMFKRAKACT